MNFKRKKKSSTHEDYNPLCNRYYRQDKSIFKSLDSSAHCLCHSAPIEETELHKVLINISSTTEGLSYSQKSWANFNKFHSICWGLSCGFSASLNIYSSMMVYVGLTTVPMLLKLLADVFLTDNRRLWRSHIRL